MFTAKPLTHTVHEARVLSDLARQNQLVTQMGTQIHAGNNYRRVVERIQSGAIGMIQRVHVWVNIGHSYSNGVFTTQTPKPAHLDWDLWLGPPQNALTPKERTLSTGDNSGTMATDAWVISAATTWIWCIGH